MHVVVAGDIGGAERLLVDVAGRPEASGAEHQVAMISSTRALASYLTGAGLVVHDRGLSRENPLAYLSRSFGPWDVRWLAGLLAEQRIDIVHTHTFGSHVLGTRAARRAGVPQVRTEHHVVHFSDPACSVFTRWAAARTERFVAVSDYVRRVLAQSAPTLAARTTVVRNGVDTDYWSPRARDANDAPEAPDAPFSLAVVCRLTAWKRVDLAIEAAAMADVDLVVVGDGEDRGKLEALAQKLGARVRFVGHQADPRPFLAAASATISTAKDEPLGLSVLESLSMERAVIAFAGGGIPEIVQHGETGALVAEATPRAFANAITSARADRERLRRLGVNGRRFVEDQCSVTRMCEGYAAVYREMTGRS